MSKSRGSCLFTYIIPSQTGLGSPFGGPEVLCLAQSYMSSLLITSQSLTNVVPVSPRLHYFHLS